MIAKPPPLGAWTANGGDDDDADTVGDEDMEDGLLSFKCEAGAGGGGVATGTLGTARAVGVTSIIGSRGVSRPAETAGA